MGVGKTAPVTLFNPDFGSSVHPHEEGDIFPDCPRGLAADVIICSLVYDVVATDDVMLQEAMAKTLR